MDSSHLRHKEMKNNTKEELLNLDKKDLIDKILQLEAHTLQLRNILNKKVTVDAEDRKTVKKKPFDFKKCYFRRILLKILYFGWDYQGLAVQEDSTQTIEYHLFHALTKSCLIECREKSQYHRCGRTDKGVSAFGQVISLTLRSKYSSEQQHLQESLNSEMPYCKILNRLLPKDIRAIAWMPLPDDQPEYSARFNCQRRQYKYYFPRSNLNLNKMSEACSHIIGSKDFRNICKMDVGNGVTEFYRQIFKAVIFPVEVNDVDKPSSMYCLIIEGNAFLWHQIRCIMGLLLLIGQGNEEPNIITQLLDVENNPRNKLDTHWIASDTPSFLYSSAKTGFYKIPFSKGVMFVLQPAKKPQYNMALDVPLNLFHCSYNLEETNRWVYHKDELRSIIATLQGDWTINNIKTTMIKDSLSHLENEYKKLNDENKQEEKGKETEGVWAYTDCLLQGVKPKVYTPLLKRGTCSSLEEKIEHYKKKRKLNSPKAVV